MYRPVPHGQPGRGRRRARSDSAASASGATARARAAPRRRASPRRRPPRDGRRGRRGPGRRARRRRRARAASSTRDELRPAPWASARAVATPIRRPVNVPGPTPTPMRSRRRSQPRAEHLRASGSSARRGRAARPAPGIVAELRGSRRRRQRRRRWPGSRCRSRGRSCRSMLTRRAVAAQVLQAHAARGCGPGRPVAAALRPFDERDAVGPSSSSSSSGSSARGRPEAKEVEVGDRHAAVLVAARDREGRARDRHAHPERTGGAADEGGLAGAEVARDEDDVAGAERRARVRRRAPRSPRPSRSRWTGQRSACGRRQRARPAEQEHDAGHRDGEDVEAGAGSVAAGSPVAGGAGPSARRRPHRGRRGRASAGALPAAGRAAAGRGPSASTRATAWPASRSRTGPGTANRRPLRRRSGPRPPTARRGPGPRWTRRCGAGPA